MTNFANELRALRSSPAPVGSDEDFVARVMAACNTAPTPRVRWRVGLNQVAGAISVAACASLGLWAWSNQAPGEASKPTETLTARGNAAALSLGATVQAFVGQAPPGGAPPLLEGAILRRGDGILLRYSNPTDRERYLMVFALDQKGAVHWLHPAYLEAGSNPTSLRLPPRVSERVLPEVAEPEAPAPGELRVFSLLSEAALDVQSVERRLSSGSRPVPELFPEAEVEAWRCTWQAQ